MPFGRHNFQRTHKKLRQTQRTQKNRHSPVFKVLNPKTTFCPEIFVPLHVWSGWCWWKMDLGVVSAEAGANVWRHVCAHAVCMRSWVLDYSADQRLLRWGRHSLQPNTPVPVSVCVCVITEGQGLAFVLQLAGERIHTRGAPSHSRYQTCSPVDRMRKLICIVKHKNK